MNSKINKATKFIDLGLMDYQKVWDYQTSLFNSILKTKATNTELSPEQQIETENFLIFCEHPHVYTIGKNGDENNLLIKQEHLKDIQASFFPINRGGDITYHGPGQQVVYFVIDLENFFTDIHRFMRLLEESVILTLEEFGIASERIEGLTGVWITSPDIRKARKICAMGVKTSRWVTMHGLALNVYPDLSYFKNIIACGINDKEVTSMAMELNEIDLNMVKNMLKEKIAGLFNMTLSD